MTPVLEKLRHLNGSKRIRYAVSFFILIISFIALLSPLALRDSKALLGGDEAYHEISGGLTGSIYSYASWFTGQDIVSACKSMPVFLGLVSIMLFFLIINKLTNNFNIAALTSLLAAISPGYIHLFSTCNSYSIPVALAMLAFALLAYGHLYITALVPIFIIPLFGYVHIITVFGLLLIYLQYNKKPKLFIALAMFSFPLLYFSSYYAPAEFGSWVTEFGGKFSISMFMVFLSYFGARKLWEQKYKHLAIYISAIFILAMAFIDQRAMGYLNFMVVYLAALGLIQIYISEWKVTLIKRLTLIIIVAGIVLSTVSYVTMISGDLPTPGMIDGLNFLKTLDGKDVMTDGSRSAWMEYAGKNTYHAQSLFYARNIDAIMPFVKDNGIDYVWIDKEMIDRIWQNDEDGMLFVLKYSNNFKPIYNKGDVIIWEFIENPELIFV